MPSFPNQLFPGSPYPLGATSDGLGVNFAVFSAHAERIDLCLFDPSGKREVARLTLPECTDEVWHGYLPFAKPGLTYGYRAYGPYDPKTGHRFNHHKLLLDPYARELSGQIRWSDALFGYRVHSNRADLSFDTRDSAAAMVKAVVTQENFDWSGDRRPNRSWSETIIYETHVRGFTMLRDDIRAPERGTFAALGDPHVIDYLVRLGITAIELLPVHAFVQDRHLVQKKLNNYWGYNSLAFFAPEPRYLSEGGRNEFRATVRRLHAAGIEVFLDVVYNHTAEGSELGPTLSFRGLDNASYYRLVPGEERHCINDTGTGNTLNTSHPRVLQMVADSLRYWTTSFGIDGFRFDLGSTLGREPHGFDPGAGFFDVLRQDPVLAQVKLISEPWDIGPGGYQLGNHPPGFAEWNDRYRDGVRRFWRGDSEQRGDVAARLAGSSDIFDRRTRRPWASINFLTAHDGFTLEDAVSYEGKHNEANGEDGRDGHGENYTANWGVEGPTEDPEILEKRAKVKRAMLATLFFSHGTPMLLAGDEFGRSQQGNNNAYCQDNEISWTDWTLANTSEGRALVDYVSQLAKIRRAFPVLRWPEFLHGQTSPAPDLPDISWYDESGQPLSQEAWEDPEGRRLIMVRAAKSMGDTVEVLALLLNASGEALDFTLPFPHYPWRVLIDSARPDANDSEIGTSILVDAPAAVLVAARLESES